MELSSPELLLRRTAPSVAVVVSSLIVGLAATVAASLVLALGALLLGTAALFVGRIRGLLTVLLLGSVIMPSVVLARQTGHLGAIPLLGEATLVGCIALVAAGRCLYERRVVHVPGFVSSAVVAYGGFLLVSALVATVKGTAYPGMIGELVRQLTLLLAFPIGLVVGAATPSPADRLRLYRTVALVGILAAVSSVVYWLWARGNVSPPGLAGVFNLARETSQFASDRSVFPFVEDGSNLAAVILIMVAAFATPALLLGGRRQDIRLVTLLVCAVFAATLTTKSRTGLVTIAITPLPFLALAQAGRLRRRLVIGAAVLLALLVSGYLAFFTGDRRLSAQAEGVVSRQIIWDQAFPAFSQHPLLGNGFRYSAQNRYIIPAPTETIGAPAYRYTSVHGEFLEQLVDGGVVGAAIFLLLCASFVRLGLGLLRSSSTRADGIGVLCLLSALFSSMLANSSFESSTIVTLAFLFLGLAGSAPLASHRA